MESTNVTVPVVPATLPVIDISPLTKSSSSSADAEAAALQKVVDELREACLRFGFFYIKNHGIDENLIARLFAEGKRFFGECPHDKKESIHMRNNAVFRGWFELQGEYTSKKKDFKEGLYFGAELGDDAEEVKAKLPMHGRNQWPDPELFPGFDKLIIDYMDALTELGHQVMRGIALSLNLSENYFREQFTSSPFTPFRLFYYPADPLPREEQWGVGQHTDYGVLTILGQDDVGGLEVLTKDGQWIAAPPIPGTFVVNIGDMLETWTCGLYKATPHRVKNSSAVDRLSAPFFFDPNFKCLVSPLEHCRRELEAKGQVAAEPREPILYGRYILNKVLANFPELQKDALTEISP
ncbi:oxidoreductase [Acanthamoeba castellanii str. Neff]|uniref:Oxidoreductase n=1 Tax=Acanthamoeba castellanii (strain ATCC 30010 / Neff) TaxID=1257118 RepID=L8HIU7_ACACF|nr:oxidoreductase [Acanthamoeba castellanii str. Neff]ELR24593.1 oxidoreductase [Acanthamoeba castellanii str. Neff]